MLVESLQEGELFLCGEASHVEPAGVAPGAEIVALLLQLPETGAPEAMQLRAELALPAATCGDVSLAERVHRERSTLGRLSRAAAAAAAQWDALARRLRGPTHDVHVGLLSSADLIPERDDGAVVAKCLDGQEVITRLCQSVAICWQNKSRIENSFMDAIQ